MARRRIQEDDDVSLFPFLSIICAIIGVLTLMIAAVALGQMNEESVRDSVRNAIELEQLKKELAAIDAEIQRLESAKSQLVNNAGTRQKELISLQEELRRIQQQLDELTVVIDEQKKVRIAIPKVPARERESIAEMQKQLAETKEQVGTLQAELEKKKGPPDDAEVAIVPSGTGLNFIPMFVECTADTIVLHTENPPVTIRSADVSTDAKFAALLQGVATDQNRSLIFLLRSDSLGTYRTARKLCDDRNVRHGKLPAVGNGRLNLQYFR